MLYKAKVAVCSDIRTKHSTQGERHVEFLSIKPGGTERNSWALKGKHWKILRFAHTLYFCVLFGSQNQERMFPCAALTGLFL